MKSSLRSVSGLPRIPLESGIADDLVKALARLHPLTILRGPRGYGKTSAVVTWLRQAEDLPEVVYTTLTTVSNEREGFWAQLRDALARIDDRLDAPPSPEEDTERVVTTWLAQRREPLLVIIDDYHEAGLRHGAASIDDALVDLVRQNDQLYLAAAGRTLRALETVGSLSVDTLVIGPDELRLTGDMVYALATRTGVQLTHDRAEQIVVDLGGWPSAIRAGLQRAAASGGRDTAEVTFADNFIGAMVRDLRFENVRAFLLRTAIPEQFDIETARVIAPEGNTVRMLRNIRAAGLLAERRTVDGQSYSYPPAIRAALIRVMRESRPEVEHEVHLELMRLAAGRHDPAESLVHAVHAGEWTAALDVIENDWGTLLTTAPRALVQAAQMFPAPMVAENVRLRVATRYLSEVADPVQKPIWTGAESASFNAELAIHRTERVDAGDDELLLLMQWGATCLLMGDLDTAMYAFAQARAWAMRTEGETESYLGAAGLALVHALQGEPDQALRWLEEPGVGDWLDSAQREGALDSMAMLALSARALALVDAAHPDAEAAVELLAESRHRDELWALSVFIRSLHVMRVGSRDDIVRQANVVRSALRYIRRGSLIETLLTATLVEVLIEGGMLTVAREVTDSMEHRGFTWNAIARLRLAQERYSEAIDAARTAIQSSAGSGRYLLAAHAVVASAELRSGRFAEAREAFRAAISRARQTGQRRGFALMQRYAFTALAGGDEAVLSLWPNHLPAAELAEEADEDLPMVTLTVREAQVLHALEEHAGPVGIAHALGLSVNTVKTHMRAVYRKLDVSNRNQALSKVGRIMIHN